VSSVEPEKVERLSPDPFLTARKVSGELRKSVSVQDRERVQYLWMMVTPDGIGQSEDARQNPTEPPSVDHWLNVIDEVASIGVEKLVISARTELSNHPHIWEICHWAQDTHDMTVGIHVFSCNLAEAELSHLMKLNLEKTILFVSDENFECMQSLESRGIRVRVAQRMPDKMSNPCTMPSEMVFVNPKGQLYTCGMVEGADKYRLGSIYEGLMSKITDDPEKPHAVPKSDVDEKRGCEGCPPLLSRYFYE